MRAVEWFSEYAEFIVGSKPFLSFQRSDRRNNQLSKGWATLQKQALSFLCFPINDSKMNFSQVFVRKNHFEKAVEQVIYLVQLISVKIAFWGKIWYNFGNERSYESANASYVVATCHQAQRHSRENN